jgi:hypothetical protein
MNEDFSRLIAEHDKCKRRFDEFESFVMKVSLLYYYYYYYYVTEGGAIAKGYLAS